MIDLHCHLLPGIDDGPPDVEGSVAMARRALRAGIETVVATPHVNSRYPNDPETIAAGVAEVRERARRAKSSISMSARAPRSRSATWPRRTRPASARCRSGAASGC